MMMQLLWLIFIYFLTGLTVHSKPKFPSQKRKHRFSSTKSLVMSFMIGLGGVMTADWLSDGNPLWPALGLISGVAGGLFPVGGKERSFKTGLAVYCGGVFYLKPVIALTGFSIALEGLILSKDRILTVILFSSILPVLFSFSQINPYFFWTAVVIQLLFLIVLKNEIRSRISEFFKSKKKEHDPDKI